MESMKIIEEKENKIFNRKEIRAEIQAPKTPNKEELSNSIAEKFSVEKGLVVIENIDGKFGSSIFSVSAKIYNSSGDKEKIEPKSKKDKKAAAEASAQPAQ
jgi:ribosomal protein S24E